MYIMLQLFMTVNLTLIQIMLLGFLYYNVYYQNKILKFLFYFFFLLNIPTLKL